MPLSRERMGQRTRAPATTTSSVGVRPTIVWGVTRTFREEPPMEGDYD